MKKLLVILASALMVMAVAVSCGSDSKKGNENKAVELAGQLINAAKAGDIAAYAEASYAMEKFGMTLSEEETTELEKVLDATFSEEDKHIIKDFERKNWKAIDDYQEEHGLVVEPY